MIKITKLTLHHTMYILKYKLKIRSLTELKVDNSYLIKKIIIFKLKKKFSRKTIISGQLLYKLRLKNL